jgi:hypothetical protein
MFSTNRSAKPFEREPIERGYHIAALAAALHKIADADPTNVAQADVRHMAVAIEDEARALIGELEKIELVESERDKSADAEATNSPHEVESGPIKSVDVARVYDTLIFTKGLFEAAYVVAEKRLELPLRNALDAAIYAIEEKVEEAEKKLAALAKLTD